MSVLTGRLSAGEACRFVLGNPVEQQIRQAAARYTTAGRLRQAGFAVVHTPGRIRGGIHASVIWPDDDPLSSQQVPWPEEVSAQFDACFNG